LPDISVLGTIQMLHEIALCKFTIVIDIVLQKK